MGRIAGGAGALTKLRKKPLYTSTDFTMPVPDAPMFTLTLKNRPAVRADTYIDTPYVLFFLFFVRADGHIALLVATAATHTV